MKIFPNQYWDKSGPSTGSGQATTTRHIYDDRGGLIATIEANGTATTTYYIHVDHLGGTNVVTDSSGEVVEVVDYLPFGEINTNEAPVGFKTERKYTGHIYDESSELNYMNARQQDPKIGRFLSQDPMFIDIGGDMKKYDRKLNQVLSNPQELNSYSYVLNNPVNYYDPNGESAAGAPLGPIGFLFLALASPIQGSYDPVHESEQYASQNSTTNQVMNTTMAWATPGGGRVGKYEPVFDGLWTVGNKATKVENAAHHANTAGLQRTGHAGEFGIAGVKAYIQETREFITDAINNGYQTKLGVK